MKKSKKRNLFVLIATILGVGVATFMITSLAMASNNGHSLKEEWQSWKPAVEETVETPEEDVEADGNISAGDGELTLPTE